MKYLYGIRDCFFTPKQRSLSSLLKPSIPAVEEKDSFNVTPASTPLRSKNQYGDKQAYINQIIVSKDWSYFEELLDKNSNSPKLISLCKSLSDKSSILFDHLTLRLKINIEDKEIEKLRSDYEFIIKLNELRLLNKYEIMREILIDYPSIEVAAEKGSVSILTELMTWAVREIDQEIEGNKTIDMAPSVLDRSFSPALEKAAKNGHKDFIKILNEYFCYLVPKNSESKKEFMKAKKEVLKVYTTVEKQDASILELLQDMEFTSPKLSTEVTPALPIQEVFQEEVLSLGQEVEDDSWEVY